MLFENIKATIFFKIWPKKGQHVLAQYDDDTIIVYQAFKPSIAKWAVENQKFGGKQPCRSSFDVLTNRN